MFGNRFDGEPGVFDADADAGPELGLFALIGPRGMYGLTSISDPGFRPATDGYALSDPANGDSRFFCSRAVWFVCPVSFAAWTSRLGVLEGLS